MTVVRCLHCHKRIADVAPNCPECHQLWRTPPAPPTRQRLGFTGWFLVVVGGLVALAVIIHYFPPAEPYQSAQERETLDRMAQHIRRQGFVCRRVDTATPQGITHTGEQVSRLWCDQEALTYRATLSRDGARVSIRPW